MQAFEKTPFTAYSFRAAAYLLDDILFADLREHQRHHIESLFLFCISGISIH